jgi:type I restriction-modification system DNA methylase subunit
MSGRISECSVSKVIFAVAVLFAATAYVQAGTRQSEPPKDQSSADAQAQNIAEAARRSREQAKSATKPSKVITDDDLDKKGVKPGQQGLTVDAPARLETQPPTADQVAAATTTPTAATTDPAAAPAASDDPEAAQLKEQIADAEKDADLGKRELALQQDAYLSNPDHEHDTAGKAKVDALQQQIADKQQEIDRLKTRLAAAQELHKTPPPPAKPASPSTKPPAAPANPPASQLPASAPPSQQ